MKIGFEYARFVTKEMQQIEPHLLDPDPDDVRSDLAETETGADHESSLVATSDEVLSIYSVCVCVCLCACTCVCEVVHLIWLQVLEELGLDEEDLVDAPVMAAPSHSSSPSVPSSPPVSPPSSQLPSSSSSSRQHSE